MSGYSTPAIGGAAGFVDLHMHSTASDGSAAPAEVVRKAKRVGLSVIALTDHDTVDGVAAAQAEGERLGIRVIPGVELSAFDGAIETHILALHVSRVDLIADRLQSFRDARRVRAETMVAQLQAIGLSIDMQSVLAQSAEGVIGRPHIARALIAAGAVVDQKEAFDRYIAAGRPGYVPKEQLTLEEAVDITHRAGGIAVWAHPGRDGTYDRIKVAKDRGMDGVEVRHPGHTPMDIERIGAAAIEFNMLRSGGSDWHGADKGMRVLGCMNVPMQWLIEQDAHVSQQMAAL